MVLDRADVIIKPGMMEEFLEGLRRDALPLTGQFTGCGSFRPLPYTAGAKTTVHCQPV